ncbi:hypothetical protein QUF76_10335 [Desulfobacterales bacterium HSG16]|nr:hypothetical protein [Desulfobacterales bacterium HSG16]
MEKAYRRHKNLIDSSRKASNQTHHMVLFYAVECGLKVLYMRNNRIEHTRPKGSGSFPKSPVEFDHNLNKLLNSLRWTDHLPQVVTNDHNPKQISPGDVHQAWRYGRELDHDKEKKFIKILNQILKKLNSRI